MRFYLIVILSLLGLNSFAAEEKLEQRFKLSYREVDTRNIDNWNGYVRN